jgi:hypothetical protein
LQNEGAAEWNSLTSQGHVNDPMGVVTGATLNLPMMHRSAADERNVVSEQLYLTSAESFRIQEILGSILNPEVGYHDTCFFFSSFRHDALDAL